MTFKTDVVNYLKESAWCGACDCQDIDRVVQGYLLILLFH